MRHADLIAQLRERGVSERVVAAMTDIPRDQFVPEQVREHAWEDRPLPIGNGQTISQPTLVGMMLDVLDVGPGSRVLDVGTGSGFQAALLAALGATVFSVERICSLAETARQTLARLGCPVVVRCADGASGWPEEAPFDAIVVAAASDGIPPALLEQLAAPSAAGRGGRLLLPLRHEESRSSQGLVLVERTATGFDQRVLMEVAFVPLIVDRRT